MFSDLPKWKPNAEFWLAAISATMGIVMLAFVMHLGLVKSLTDQNAHLNAARLAFDSMTPGISQIGFWPPLLHLLMMPFTLIQSLYSTGAAGAFVLIPALAIAAIFLYRITLLYTNDSALSFVAGLLLVLNPYVLYYAVTPMMEILFLANLFGVAYFLGLWLARDQLKYLLYCGIFVTLACLSRFEGLILIPLVSFIVLVRLIRKNKNYSEIEAVMLLFLILAVLGVVGVAAYSWIFSGNPLTFTGGSWLRNPAEATFPTKHDLAGSFKYMLYASYYMLSKSLVLLSALSFGVFMIFSKKRFSSAAVLGVLFSPFVFIATTLFTGTGSIAVANLPPFNFFSNERYSLTWIGFVILTPILLIGMLAYYFSKSEQSWIRGFGQGVKFILAASLIALASLQFYNVSVAQKFAVIRENINSPLPSQMQVSQYFQKHYDFGKILITKADNDPILANSGLMLSDYIYEGNYLYFSQTNDEPWLFARFVVMHNPSDSDPWAKDNEAVMRKWGNSTEFNTYYTLVLQNPQRRVYKINEAKVRQMAQARGLDVSKIPSLNPTVVTWDPKNIYAEIQSHPTVGTNSLQ